MKKLALFLGLCALPACQPSLNRQPKAPPLAESSFFPDGASARPLPHGVVPYREKGEARAVTLREKFERGRTRYDIYCSACHGYTGEGGLVVTRGFGPVPSLLAPAAAALPEARVVEIVRDGLPRMAAMGDRLPPSDILAVAAYLRALQFSQHAPVSELAPRDRAALTGGEP